MPQLFSQYNSCMIVQNYNVIGHIIMFLFAHGASHNLADIVKGTSNSLLNACVDRLYQKPCNSPIFERIKDLPQIYENECQWPIWPYPGGLYSVAV